MESSMKKQLIDFYLDWVNNYVTLSKMAEAYGLTNPQAQKLIELGRELNEQAAKDKAEAKEPKPDKYKYPENSSEGIIERELTPLIEKIKQIAYTDDFKKSPDFHTEDTNLETLGMIVSKYCQWDGNKIETVAIEAFQDSNFSNVEINY